MGSQLLEQPLLSPSTTAPSEVEISSGPRILDRDGDFSQSRGRWRVSNINSRSRISAGSVRQRYFGRAANATALSENSSESLPRRPHSPPPTYLDRLFCRSNVYCCCCCREAHHKPRLTPRRCWDDWFHNLSYTPTCILMLGIFFAYFVTIVIFAGLYLTMNKVGSYGIFLRESDVSYSETTSSFCGMDINNHMEALYFSLSTMATIGYGTSDYYFGDCWTPFILVLLQVFSAIVFSSLAIGLLFQRISRGQKRGRTIVFSDTAVIRQVGGSWYFMIRVAELRKRHIIGAKVRLYCVKHERCPVTTPSGEGGAVELETAFFVSQPLSLMNGPSSLEVNNEENPNFNVTYEQNIIMGLPHVVVHKLDTLSPILPARPVWYDEEGTPHGRNSVSDDDMAPSSILMAERQILAQGSTFMNEIIHFLQDRQAEIIVFLEGTCEVTGMALQARQSYRLEDIAFNHTFAPCVYPAGSTLANKGGRWNPFTRKRSRVVDGSCDERHSYQSDAMLEIDFSQFHQIIPTPHDSISCPYVPSSNAG